MNDMNELTNKLQQVMVPKAALIAYEYRENRYGNGMHYLELHPINDRGRMEAAMPVTYEFMDSLVESYTDDRRNVPHGKIPANMLWCDTRKGHERYIWYNPPQKRMMFFKESLQVENAKYNLPGVIYVAGGSSLSIYAYKDKKLTEKTDLYAAPFFNVTGANVCLGSAKIDKPRDLTYKNLLEYWEKKFWLTEFSHLGGGGNPTRSNLVLVTKAAKDKLFNLDELKPLNNLKLKDILK